MIRMEQQQGRHLKHRLEPERRLELYLIRHGQTEGNVLNLYVGRTDQPLTEHGVQVALQCAQSGCYPLVERVYVTPLQRTQQTAGILFPGAELIVVDDFIEMDFGDFEGRHSDELRGDPDYVDWVSAECVPSCPNGESGLEFNERVCKALAALIAAAFDRGEQCLVIVAHGGVGMTLMASFALPELPFYRWWMPNCGGYRVVVERQDWEAGKFSSWEVVGRGLWRNRAYSFFQNVECEYFPCHETRHPEDFSCLFCFCPLYHLGADCGGDARFSEQGLAEGVGKGAGQGVFEGVGQGAGQGAFEGVGQGVGQSAGQGVMDCSACLLPHHRNGYGFITERLEARLSLEPTRPID